MKMSNITFDQTSGASGVSVVNFSVGENITYQDIVSRFLISNGEENVRFSISQRAKESESPFINMSGPLSYPSSGGRLTLTVSSNDDWYLDGDDWIMFGIKKGHSGSTILPITVMENTGSTRNGTITGYCKSDNTVSATTTVSQSGGYVAPYITLGYYELKAESESAHTVVAISSNIGWSAMTDSRWITIETVSGTGNTNLFFDINENFDYSEREGTITVYNDEYKKSAILNITQKGAEKPYIKLGPITFDVPYSGSTGNTINIDSNCDYDIETDADWIILSADHGSGIGSVSFNTISASEASKASLGNITFTHGDLSENVEVYRRKAF